VFLHVERGEMKLSVSPHWKTVVLLASQYQTKHLQNKTFLLNSADELVNACDKKKKK